MSQPSGKQILYVDDEPQALKYFALMFGEDFDVVTAESADEAFRHIESDPGRIAVLVTDQRMPGRTGVQLMEQVRVRYPNIVRVLTTAHTHLESAIKAVNEGGAFRYLTKPWNEDEMTGTLLRASEYHAAMEQRDQLLAEKLSVLHRLIVMDRVRGLATAATALQGRVRGAWPALVAYMQAAPVSKRIRIQMEEILGLNMTALARREGEQMVRTVEMLLADTVAASTGDEPGTDVAELTRHFADQIRPGLAEDDLELNVVGAERSLQVTCDRGMLRRLLEILVRRLADIQEHPAEITVDLASGPDRFSLAVRASFEQLQHDQVAALFAAAIPLKKWPIGLDMDLLSAFMIVHHLGGTLRVETASPNGPAFVAELPVSPPPEEATPVDPAWFDTVYESLQAWQDEVFAL